MWMRPVVTDRVAWLMHLLSVTVVSSAKTAEPIKMPFGLPVDLGGSKEPCVRWWSGSAMGRDNFEGNGRPIV